jgi:hypothetical protein
MKMQFRHHPRINQLHREIFFMLALYPKLYWFRYNLLTREFFFWFEVARGREYEIKLLGKLDPRSKDKACYIQLADDAGEET